jgi:hypothetical protein
MTTDPIDYEALAKAARDYAIPASVGVKEPPGVYWEGFARAVVASLRDQMRARGIVEVRADDLNELMGINPIGDGAARRMREALDG